VPHPHYNKGRAHASLGPGIPEVPPEKLAQPTGHHIRDGHRVIAAPILAGLHHEYRLEPLAAWTMSALQAASGYCGPQPLARVEVAPLDGFQYRRILATQL
jgi:hypothetical protein